VLFWLSSGLLPPHPGFQFCLLSPRVHHGL
jgi:hypothetical protein